jgi:oligopeptide/dipeptide ABC transporter ATP-binding protein
MYLGRIVEIGSSDSVCRAPRHPYTEALLRAIPIADPRRMRVEDLGLIEGDAVEPAKAAACPFEPRCPKRFAPCGEAPPPLVEVAPFHQAACYLNDPEAQGRSS